MKKLLLLTFAIIAFSCDEKKTVNGFTFDFEMPTASTTGKKAVNNQIVKMPNFTGDFKTFTITETSNFSPELQAQYPEIRSYTGTSADGSVIGISTSPEGLTAVILDENGTTEIKPNAGRYIATSSTRGAPLECKTPDPIEAQIDKKLDEPTKYNRSAAENGYIKQYRLALTCDYQYAAHFGGTATGVLAAYNATMTKVNMIFRRDTGIQMVLIPETISLMNLKATDVSFYPGDINLKVQNFFTDKIGNAKYDIGHAFLGAISGGNAGYIGNLMRNPTTQQPYGKGSGYTGDRTTPFGSNFDIDYVAHEMGHQFGAYHTFSHRCEGTNAQVEVGGGSTITSYAGIAGVDNNLQAHADDYFHGFSMQQITTMAKARGATILPLIATGNRSPVVNAGVDLVIPKNTLIYLEGIVSDPDGDVLTYCWETTNSGCAQGEPTADALTPPKFRSFPPTNTPIRILGARSIIEGKKYKWETLPYPTKWTNEVLQMEVKMTLTARDNKGEYGQDLVTYKVSNLATPFYITSQSATATYEVGTSQAVTWEVGGTRTNGINCTKVDVLLSTDGGYTFPIKLLSATENDGSENITIPNNIGGKNRIMVKGTNHVFCDISKGSVTIKAKSVVTPPIFNDDVDDSGNAPLNLSYNKTTQILSWSANTTFPAVSYSIYIDPTCDDTSLAGNSCEKWKASTSALTYKIALKAGQKVAVKGKNINNVRSNRAIITIN